MRLMNHFSFFAANKESFIGPDTLLVIQLLLHPLNGLFTWYYIYQELFVRENAKYFTYSLWNMFIWHTIKYFEDI